MTLRKVYFKAPPGYTIRQRLSWTQKLRLTISLTLIALGISFLTSVFYPLLEYQFIAVAKFKHSPTSPQPVLQTNLTNQPVFLPEMVNNQLDYTQAHNWFPQTQPVKPQSLSHLVTYYTLSIPKLGIEDALVKVGGEDLKASLIQYQGTALPGELGNPVIYGHSVLPQYFDPHNYTRIFSTLYTLKPGDKIIIKLDKVEYTYVITDMYEVKPDNLSPLAQAYDGYHLTLITCTPPGTFLRRLIVRAELQ